MCARDGMMGSICSHPFVSTSSFQALPSEAPGSGPQAGDLWADGGNRPGRKTLYWDLLFSSPLAVGDLGTSVSLSVKWDSDAGTPPNQEANKEMGRGVKPRKTLLLPGSQDALLPPRSGGSPQRDYSELPGNSSSRSVRLFCPFYRRGTRGSER